MQVFSKVHSLQIPKPCSFIIMYLFWYERKVSWIRCEIYILVGLKYWKYASLFAQREQKYKLDSTLLLNKKTLISNHPAK